MEITEEHKKELENQIVETLMAALNDDVITSDELPDISDFVLDRIDAIKTQDDLIRFVQELSAKWQMFSKLATIERSGFKEKAEDEVAKGVLSLAQEGKIEDAIDLAKTMTSVQPGGA